LHEHQAQDKNFFNGIAASTTNINPYQYHSRLNKGGQSFATINAKAATQNFVSPKSTHVSLPILSFAQSNMLIFLVY